MATVVDLGTSPATVLSTIRGKVLDASIAYPEVLHVEGRDAGGALWRLATQDSEFSPSDPSQLVGRTVEGAEIDELSGELRCMLTDGVTLAIRPAAASADDDPPYWEVIDPQGVLLEFGPGLRWQISSAVELVSSRR